MYRMKHKSLISSALLVAIAVTCAEVQADEPGTAPMPKGEICLLSGIPPLDVKYTKVGEVKIAKHSFGSVNDVIPLLVDKAKRLNADAIIEYNGSQRFGFLPWQFVRPTASGTAVTWTLPDNVTCESMGGTYKTTLAGSRTSSNSSTE
jgi:hypothetical protein